MYTFTRVLNIHFACSKCPAKNHGFQKTFPQENIDIYNLQYYKVNFKNIAPDNTVLTNVKRFR